jgi:muramoyltetrapeptide carboxypeptidase
MQDSVPQPIRSEGASACLGEKTVRKRRIRVVAPAGPVDEKALEAGLAVLSERGYEVAEGRHVREKLGYLAGCDAARLADLQEAMNDNDAFAVWFARGGYGTARLLPDIRWNSNGSPKIVAGYSDATALHLWARRFANIQSLYAPSITELGRPGVALLPSLWAALDMDFAPVPGDGPSEPAGPFPIVGGCLTLCCASAGTFWAPETTGCWVFLEEVGEKLYRIDRMLIHLKQAGWFDKAAGLLLGAFTGLGDGETAKDVAALAKELAPSGLPVVTGIPVGHITGKHTLPFGVPTTWDGRFLRPLSQRSAIW